MASYTFADITAAQAAAFTTGNADSILFATGVTASAVTVTYVPQVPASGASPAIYAHIDVSYNGRTVSFGGAAADFTGFGTGSNFQFTDGSKLMIGANTADSWLTGDSDNDVI